MKKKADLVIFDLDRTITRSGTFTPYLLGFCHKKPLLIFKIPIVLFHMARYVANRISRGRLKEYMLSHFMAGMPREEVDAHSRAFVNRLFHGGVFREALKEIKGHQQKGNIVVLATASMDFYVKHISRKLELDYAICTKSAWKNNCLQPALKGPNCYGEAKAAYVKKALPGLKKKYGHFDRIWFYSDHHTDRPTFDLCDIGVAVNPTRKLQKLALARDYKTVFWKQRIT